MNPVDYLAACLCVFVTLIVLAVAACVVWLTYGLILSAVNMTRNLREQPDRDREIREEAERLAALELDRWSDIPSPPEGTQVHQNGVPLQRTGLPR